MSCDISTQGMPNMIGSRQLEIGPLRDIWLQESEQICAKPDEGAVDEAGGDPQGEVLE